MCSSDLKPKKEWYVEAPLCGNCYMDKMRDEYDANIKSSCVICGNKQKVTDLWEPRWQWDMQGLLCKQCFDKKETDFDKKKAFCTLCGTKLGFFRYTPKNHWKVDGKLCRKCWDSQKVEYG